MIKKKRTTLILIVIFMIGLSVLLYPSFSDWRNSLNQGQAISSYDSAVQNLSEEQRQAILDAACNYNQALAQRSNPFALTAEQNDEYESLLSLDESGMIGYIDIPVLNQRMPVYHGTSEDVLQTSIGHL